MVQKRVVLGLPDTAGFFASLGLPLWTAYATFAAEALGGILLLLGIWSRAVALALVPVQLGALWVHAGNGWVFSVAGGVYARSISPEARQPANAGAKRAGAEPALFA